MILYNAQPSQQGNANVEGSNPIKSQKSAQQVREALTCYVNNEGSVPWQLEKIREGM